MKKTSVLLDSIHTFFKQKQSILLSILAVVILYIGLESLGVTCPIKYVTGISCAGCGMSRAWLACLHLDFSLAFFYHPLFFLPPFIVLLLIFRKKINEKLYKTLIGIIIFLFLFIYLYRMFFVNNTIVVFEPSQGITCRLFRFLFQALTNHL